MNPNVVGFRSFPNIRCGFAHGCVHKIAGFFTRKIQGDLSSDWTSGSRQPIDLPVALDEGSKLDTPNIP